MIELVDGMKPNRYGISYMDVYNEIDHMMAYEKGIKDIYYNKQDRLYAANPMCLIMFYDEPIGFINLVQEEIDNVKFLDEAIIEQYRGLGYGKEALRLLNPASFKEYVIGQTQTDNKAPNIIGSEKGCYVYHDGYFNYYLLQPERAFAFLASREYQELKDRGDGEKTCVKRLRRR